MTTELTYHEIQLLVQKYIQHMKEDIDPEYGTDWVERYDLETDNDIQTLLGGAIQFAFENKNKGDKK